LRLAIGFLIMGKIIIFAINRGARISIGWRNIGVAYCQNLPNERERKKKKNLPADKRKRRIAE